MEYPVKWAESERAAKEIKLKKDLADLERSKHVIPFNKYVDKLLYKSVYDVVVKTHAPQSLPDKYGLSPIGAETHTQFFISELKAYAKQDSGMGASKAEQDIITAARKRFPKAFEILNDVEAVINGRKTEIRNIPKSQWPYEGYDEQVDYELILSRLKKKYGEMPE